jgi:site-specific DNA-cytosine methylase
MIAGADARVMPIEFSAPMVRALLAGRKTETRRLISSPLARVRRGDLLWVKEAVRIGREMPRSGGRTEVRFEYAADGTVSAVDWPSRLARPAPGGRSARFVPPELSRLTLRVEDARPQRLADIDDQSALAEGIVPCVWPDTGVRGYGFAWRVLDAQFVRTRLFRGAVPQRRRRVFVVGYLGGWAGAAAVLFDAESLRGHPPPSRSAGQAAAPTLACRPTGGGGLGTDFDLDGGLIPEIAATLRAEGFDASEDGTGRGTPIIPAVVPQALSAKWAKGSSGPAGDETANLVPVAPTLRAGGNRTGGDRPPGTDADTCDRLIPVALNSRQDPDFWLGHSKPLDARLPQAQAFAQGWAVRRLTPLECERLQGFPDGYTDIPWGARNWTPDGPRYKALGNSMACNAMHWIGERIAAVDAILRGIAE